MLNTVSLVNCLRTITLRSIHLKLFRLQRIMLIIITVFSIFLGVVGCLREISVGNEALLHQLEGTYKMSFGETEQRDANSSK